jgi:hypothetical protein
VTNVVGVGWLHPHVQIVLEAAGEHLGRAYRTNADVHHGVYIGGDRRSITTKTRTMKKMQMMRGRN